MTECKIKPNPSGGHGLGGDLIDSIYAEMSKGKQPGLVPALVLLQPVEHAEKITAGGRKRLVRFELVRLEPVVDEDEGVGIREAISVRYDARNEMQGQASLELDGRNGVLAAISDWASENNMGVRAIGNAWRSYFGEGNEEVPKDYRKGNQAQLREFALARGIIAEDVPDKPFEES